MYRYTEAAEAFPQYARGAAMATAAAAHWSYVLDLSTGFKAFVATFGAAAAFAGFAAVGAVGVGVLVAPRTRGLLVVVAEGHGGVPLEDAHTTFHHDSSDGDATGGGAGGAGALSARLPACKI